MRTAAILLLLALLAAGGAWAQPLDGDLVISLIYSGQPQFTRGAVLYVDPRNPGTLNTLSPNVTKSVFHNWVRMAPDNKSVVVAEASSGFTFTNLIQFDPAGLATTIAANLPGYINGIELDGDDTWIAASANTYLYGVNHTTGKMTTYLTSALPTFNEVAILREAGHKYAIANFTTSTGRYPKVYAADRTGITSTLLYTAGQPLLELSGLEVDPRTGDFITTDFGGPSSRTPEPGGVEVNRLSLGGKVTTLVSFGVNGSKIAQDDTLWLAGFVKGQPTNTPAAIHFDLATNTVVTIVKLPALGNTWPLSGIEVYGSHPLTCRGQGGPGATIHLDLNSQNPFAGGAYYQLACSFGRRPGVKLPNGQWLHLNVTDNLFILTARNRAPAVFQKFAGLLDPLGSARAMIKLPPGFPARLGLTVFCAGVIFSKTRVLQVTNTHWFEL